MATPNTSPAFIRNVGIIGQPIALTSQVCTRENPGNTPSVIYDPSAAYATGNGALVETIRAEATGVTAASCLLLFHRILDEAQPVWRKALEVTLPAVATIPTDSAIPGYPVELPLPKILFPVAGAGNDASMRGLRLNPSERPIQWGAALTVAVGTAPIIISMYGGEY
ncbi:MAG: hypothetical protein HC908_14315 [Calothrix sp. SM1_7_51]|nr:hypothetical protein [Calothrix sp. SM1_7_51]